MCKLWQMDNIHRCVEPASCTYLRCLNRPWRLQALAEKVREGSRESLHAQSLALVYDPELENPTDGERTPRRDPALRHAALSFYADMSDMRWGPAFNAESHPPRPLASMPCRRRGGSDLIVGQTKVLCLAQHKRPETAQNNVQW